MQKQIAVSGIAIFCIWLFSTAIFPQYEIFLAVDIALMVISIFVLVTGIMMRDIFKATFLLLILLVGTIHYLATGPEVSLNSSVKIFVIIGLLLILGAGVKILPAQNNWMLQSVLFGVILLNLLAQIVLVFDLAPLNNILMAYYYDGSHLQENYLKGGGDRLSGRFGGLIPNANQSAKAMTIVYCMCLALSSRRFVAIMFVVLTGLTVAMTASRTGLVVYLLITYLFFYRKMERLNLGYKIGLYGVVALFVSIFLLFSGAAERFSSGTYDDSLGYKIDYFLRYLNYTLDNDWFSLVFGNGFFADRPVESLITVGGLDFGFDSDMGYLVYYFGIPASIMLVVGVAFWFARNRYYVWALPLLLWIITSTVFFNIRSAMLFLGLVFVFKMGARGERG